MRKMNNEAPQPQVVILGAGFAGMGAVRKLKHSPVKVTLIDQNDYHTFQPLLYQVATAVLAPNEVGFPIRQVLHQHEGAVFHTARVSGIDLDQKQVLLEGMPPLAYDYLVVGLGAVANFHGAAGAKEYALPMYTLRDAVRLRHQLLATLEQVDRNPALADDGALTFCIVGGGPTGVEIAGALAEFFHSVAARDYPNLPIRDQSRVVLLEHGPHLLQPFKPRLQGYAQQALEKMGVQVRTGQCVQEIAPEHIILRSGEILKTRTLIWTAGVQANPLAASLAASLSDSQANSQANSQGIEPGKGGRIPVNPDLSLKGHPEVFIVGDMAMITDSKTDQVLPQLGSVAQQAGHHAGSNIARRVEGKETLPFEYFDKGTMATVGPGAAVVQMPGRRAMTGSAAFAAWLGVHVMLLTGSEEKAGVLVDWAWSLLTRQRGKRIILSGEGPDPAPGDA